MARAKNLKPCGKKKQSLEWKMEPLQPPNPAVFHRNIQRPEFLKSANLSRKNGAASKTGYHSINPKNEGATGPKYRKTQGKTIQSMGLCRRPPEVPQAIVSAKRFYNLCVALLPAIHCCVLPPRGRSKSVAHWAPKPPCD